jgi:chromosome segregation ATPase
VSDDNEFDFEIAAEEDDDAAQTEGRGDSEVDVENQGGVWGNTVGQSGTSTDADAAGMTQNELDRVREIIMGTPERARQPLRDGEAERLRDILFGPKMEDYERRFTDLRRDIDRVLNDVQQSRDAMDEARDAQRERVDTIERELQKNREELGRDIDHVRSQGPVIQQLVPQTRQLQLLVNSLTQEVNDLRASLTRESQDVRALRSLVEQYRDQSERSLDTVKREKRKAEDELKEELRRVADRLDDQKTDRKVLAAILVALATRLENGYNAAGTLEGLIATAED